MAEKSKIPTSEMMQVTGLSRARLSDLVAARVIPKAARGFFPYPEAPAAYCAQLREGAAGRGESSLSNERAKLAAAQREAVEQKLAITRGDYVPAADVKKEWSSILTMVRARMLALPSQVSQAIPQLTRADIDMIDQMVRDSLTELSESANDKDL